MCSQPSQEGGREKGVDAGGGGEGAEGVKDARVA